MGKMTFENVKAGDLPESWLERLGLDRTDLVTVTVETPAPKTGFDEAKVRATLARIDKLPVLDPRSIDEIIGYDEAGLPT